MKQKRPQINMKPVHLYKEKLNPLKYDVLLNFDNSHK
jgi:hypothetical protein